MQRLLRVTVGQLPVFDATLIVAATKFDDHVYVMSGYVIAAYITILFALGVEWTDYGFFHRCPHFVSALVSGSDGASRRFATYPEEVTLSPL
jgi:hypothetical protein